MDNNLLPGDAKNELEFYQGLKLFMISAKPRPQPWMPKVVSRLQESTATVTIVAQEDSKGNRCKSTQLQIHVCTYLSE